MLSQLHTMNQSTLIHTGLGRSPTLSQEELATFNRDGYLRLGQLADATQVKALCERIDQIMMGEIQYENMMMQLDSSSGIYGELSTQTVGFKGATKDYRKIEQLEKDPLFLDYMRSPVFQGLCQQLIGEDTSIFRSMFMNKPARKGTFLPWHQDGGTGWRLKGGHPLVTLWLALDPATVANGCVQLIPGSHKLGLLSEQGDFFITDEQQTRYCGEENRVYLELKPGEVALLHNWTLHASDVNKTDIARRAFAVCLMDSAISSTEAEHPGFFKLFGSGAF